jgi:hypothetical protein
MNGALNTCAPVNYAVVVADQATLAQVALAAASSLSPTHQVSNAPSAQVPSFAEEASPLDQASTDSLKRWLAGVSGTSLPSGEDLAAQLHAALPEVYDD